MGLLIDWLIILLNKLYLSYLNWGWNSEKNCQRSKIKHFLVETRKNQIKTWKIKVQKQNVFNFSDVIDDGRLSSEYLTALSDVSEQMSAPEIRISVRTYFGRIWHIFVLANSLKNKRPKLEADRENLAKILAKIEQFWDEQMDKVLENLRVIEV